jgi:hypothetical protein
MPPQIGDFISQQVYDGELHSDPGHVIPSSAIACRFIDVNGSEQLGQDDKSLLVSVVLAFWDEEVSDTKRVLTKIFRTGKRSRRSYFLRDTSKT